MDNTCFGTSNINGDLMKTNQDRIINHKIPERHPSLNVNKKPGSTLSVSIWAMGSSTSTLSPGSGYHLPSIHNKLDKKSQKQAKWALIHENNVKVVGWRASILFKNVANVPSDIDSPIKGTTASTRSPSHAQINK